MDELEMAHKCNLMYGGPKVLEHFNRIRNGEISCAQMAYHTEYDQDPYDGREYSSEYFKGWETSDQPREIRFEVLEVERDPIVVYVSTKTKPDTVFKTGFELADTPLEKGGFTNLKVSDFDFTKAEQDGDWMNLYLVTLKSTPFF